MYDTTTAHINLDNEDDSIIDSSVLDKSSLTSDKPIFREVTVSGGE